jgi:ABC-type amino acid transport substrate-binding protein
MQVAFIVPDSTLTYGWIFRAGDPLRDRVNAEINTLKRNGATAKIYKKWFGASPDPSDAAVKVLPGVTPQTCKG